MTRFVLPLLLAAFFLAPAGAFAQAKNLRKIHVGVPAVSMGNMIIFFTKEAKLFEKHGLDADVVVMQGSGIASRALVARSEEHTSELQSRVDISYAVFCLKKK